MRLVQTHHASAPPTGAESGRGSRLIAAACVAAGLIALSLAAYVIIHIAITHGSVVHPVLRRASPDSRRGPGQRRARRRAVRAARAAAAAGRSTLPVLPSTAFFRINRTEIVALAAIDQLTPDGDRVAQLSDLDCDQRWRFRHHSSDKSSSGSAG
jgi:hypothetical protein